MTASWYGEPFHGRTAADGSVYDMHEMTCAHRSLPFGALLLVEREGLRVCVRVTDRGPFIAGRELDLSAAAMKALGGIDDGVVECRAWRVR
jgi:rare lipoprotein A